MRFQGLDATIALHAATLPTSQGGALLTLAPGLKYVGTAGKLALNTVKPLLKSAVSLVSKELAALREAGRNASRLGQTPLSMQGAGNLNDKMGTSVLQSSPGYPASSVKQAQLLRNSLISEEISAGHSFEKHIVQQGEFPGWIRTREQLKSHIDLVLNDQNTTLLSIGGGRTAFIHRPSHSVVIRNPNARDGGTIFQPSLDMDTFLTQRGWK
jgi:hypothetical protein